MDEFSFYNWSDFSSYIVPPTLDPGPSGPPPQSAPSYETPWWADTINRAIERGYQAYTIQEAGYPQYPQYPTPTPTYPAPASVPTPGVTPQPSGVGGNIQLSNTTLMLIVGGVLLFMLGKRGR